MIKLGLVGCGKWGKNIRHTIDQIDNATLVNIATNSNGVNWKDLCHNPQIDSILIATPPVLHYDMTKYALQNGKHVFVEKPFLFSNSIDDVTKARELSDIAKINKLNLLVNNIHLFNPRFRKFQDIFKTIDWEKPLRIYAEGSNQGPYRDGYPGFVDYVPHDLAMVLQLIKKVPETIQCTGDEDMACIDLFFEGISVSIKAGAKAQKKTRILKVSDSNNELIFDDCDKMNPVVWNQNPVACSTDSPLTTILQEFVSTISTNELRYQADMDVVIMDLIYQCLKILQVAKA